MKRGSDPTMKDVARECGLSLATVSNVINGLPVSKKSRERVEAAIKKLGYQVNAYARALKSSKTYSVALVMPSLKHPFFAHLTDELTKSLMSKGYRAVLMITNYDPEAEQKSFMMVRGNKMDGVIALTYSPNLVVGESIPIVTIDRHLSTEIPCVSSDNYHGGEIAAEKLLELGCRRLLFMRITSPINGEPNKRCSGFESVCHSRNIDYETLLFCDDEPEEPIYLFLSDHIHDGVFDFDGIFCNSDLLACKVIAFLRERGVRIPEQVQVIGYDGIKDNYSESYVCSTIEQPIAQMAETAVSVLLDDPGKSEGMNICLPVRYVSGGTTRE